MRKWPTPARPNTRRPPRRRPGSGTSPPRSGGTGPPAPPRGPARAAPRGARRRDPPHLRGRAARHRTADRRSGGTRSSPRPVPGRRRRCPRTCCSRRGPARHRRRRHAATTTRGPSLRSSSPARAPRSTPARPPCWPGTELTRWPSSGPGSADPDRTGRADGHPGRATWLPSSAPNPAPPTSAPWPATWRPSAAASRSSPNSPGDCVVLR